MSPWPGRVRALGVLAVIAALAWWISETDPTFTGTWFTRLCAPAQTLYVLWYATLRPWRMSGPPRALFVKSAGFAILLDLILVAQITNRAYPGRAFISALGELLIFAGVYWQLGTFARSRYQVHRTHREIAELTYDSRTDGPRR